VLRRLFVAVHAVWLVVLVPGICAGQTPAPEAAAPHLVRAAGMPLNDGALAPGMLTVRIVQGTFTRNLAEQVVEVEVAGGKVETAKTGADGRAQFAHLPIGVRVRTSATIGGERLSSEPFDMPAESGVRVLLVAGDGTAPAGVAPAPSALASPHPTSEPVAPEVPQPIAPSSADTWIAAIRGALATATLFAFGLIVYNRTRR
jgi:hypothetical protein